jgi:lysophospholipid acyltransferase (LPLAT)-like uncharacterized protein
MEAKRMPAAQGKVTQRHLNPDVRGYANWNDSFADSHGTSPLYYMKMETTENSSRETREAISAHYDTRLPKLPWRRRIQIPIIAAVVYAVIRVIGPTLRIEVLGRASAEKFWADKKPSICVFWHRCIIGSMWYGRNRGIVVMNTTAFDGQWTRRVVERLGYGTAQGSSSRGGLRGLAVMAQRIREGLDCAFTIDGPRGPRYVAKVGPVLLARMTGTPIAVFHVGVDRGKTFEKTWDRFCLPSLFARAVMVGAPVIYVPQDADSETIKAKHEEMQKALERVRDIAEGWFSFSEEERNGYRAELGP